ncbi:hypothetical protein Zmor_007631 [Zophobas morio]|uniref:Odorant receptor n=1 Tax=Zophobas morio TaxID=2755281 RepID=A0AA38IUG4_9CUCU|nr:hypothetical protein Zmor_007631 [Zophobas morio]
MKHFDWWLPLKHNVTVLRLAGLWPKNEVYERNVYTFYAIFVWVILTGSHNMFLLGTIYFTDNNLESFTQTIVILVTDLLASFKVYVFISNIKVLKDLMISLNTDLFQPKNQNQIDVAWISLNLWRLTYAVFYTMAAAAVTFWVILPFLDNSFRTGRLPILAWYPYNVTISPFYELAYAHQCVSSYYFCTAIANIDLMIAALMMHVGIQCDILCDNFKKLQAFKSTRKSEDDFSKSIVSCVEHHRQILSFAKSSNEFFDKILLGQFATSTIATAVSLFEMSLVDPLSGTSLSHLMYVSGIIVQVFLYCWYGNSVEVKVSIFLFGFKEGVVLIL